MFIFCQGWQFPSREALKGEFPVNTNWCRVPDDKVMTVALSKWEQALIDMVLAWVQDEDAIWTEALLTPANIDFFLLCPITSV